MFEPIDGLPDNVIAVRAVGRVSTEDYKTTLEPAIARATEGGHQVRILLELGAGFEEYDASAVLADAGLGLEHLKSFEKVAVVTDAEWIRSGVRLFGPLIQGEVRDFSTAEGDTAKAWIAA
jgi:hypothetical protein